MTFWSLNLIYFIVYHISLITQKISLFLFQLLHLHQSLFSNSLKIRSLLSSSSIIFLNNYFKGRNFCRKKRSQFSGILGKNTSVHFYAQKRNHKCFKLKCDKSCRPLGHFVCTVLLQTNFWLILVLFIIINEKKIGMANFL